MHCRNPKQKRKEAWGHDAFLNGVCGSQGQMTDEALRKVRGIQVPQAHGQPVYPVGLYLEMYAMKKKKDEPEQSKFDIHSKPEIYRRQK